MGRCSFIQLPKKVSNMIIYVLLIFFVILNTDTLHIVQKAKGSDHPMLTLFVFGDSLVDVGNNDYIPSTARANFRPNGIDYPGGKPTGRFSNGKIVSDFLSEHYQLPLVKPYMDPSNNQSTLMLGANFASAGAGILNSTGRLFVVVLTVEEQFELFADYKQKMVSFIGEEATQKLVNNTIYSLNIGGNDYINNYFMKRSRGNKMYTLAQWQDRLITTYKSQLTQLYNMGARKMLITSVGPLGCIPMQLHDNNSSDGKCIDGLQQVVVTFNSALKTMLQQLNKELSGTVFVYVNAFDMLMDYINNPTAYGFEVSNTACCGQGSYHGSLVCTRYSTLCPDRSKYVFWDPFHPTERVNYLIAQRVISGPPSDISPINLSQLVGF